MDRCLLHAHCSDISCGRWYEWRSTTKADGAPHTLNSTPSYACVGSGEFVCASCVPKLKLSSPRARLFFSQGEVVALHLILCPCGWPPSDLSERIVYIAMRCNTERSGIFQTKTSSCSLGNVTSTRVHLK